jgi:ubiquinone biosynthesis protein UbiJ
MAKKPDQAGAAKSRADQLRSAVEGAFGATAQGAGPVQKRAQELADELVGAAARLRDALGDDPAAVAGRARKAVEGLRPPSPEEVDALRTQVEALEARVAELEAAAAKRPTTTTRRAAAAKKPAAKKPAARRKPAGGQAS